MKKYNTKRQRSGRIGCDNGTEFISKTMLFWSLVRGAKLGFVQRNSLTQKAFLDKLARKVT